MKTKLFFSITFIGLFSFQLLATPVDPITKKHYTKEEAITKIKALQKNTKYNIEANKEFVKIIENASSNFGSIVYYTELSIAVGYHTELFLAIAEIASKSKNGIKYIDEIAELAGMKLTETGGLVDLAKQAAKAKTADEIKKVEDEIVKLKSTAEFKTIQEAIAKAESDRENK
jgi:hypothetical protein